MPRLKMCGILPPLLHVFMALRINSGTLSFANSVTFATFIANICLFCVTAFVKYLFVKYKSSHFSENYLFPSLCMWVHVYTHVSIDMCA